MSISRRNDRENRIWADLPEPPPLNPALAQQIVSADEIKDSFANTICPNCKGRGVIIGGDVNRTGVVCCDQCDTGRIIWSRMLELLTDMDIPSPAPGMPEPVDSVVRGRTPMVHPPQR